MDEAKYDYSQFTKNVKRDCPTNNKIFAGVSSIGKIMQTFHSNIANTGNHGHSFLIYTNIKYLSFGHTAAIIPPTKPMVYTGFTTTNKYAYEEEQATYNTYKWHFDAVKRMIFYIFSETYFLALMGVFGHMSYP